MTNLANDAFKQMDEKLSVLGVMYVKVIPIFTQGIMSSSFVTYLIDSLYAYSSPFL